MGGMPGMDSSPDTSAGGGAPMTMMAMQSVFQSSQATPLYSAAWTPQTPAGYAGTCVFLVVLAAALRGLLAAKAYLEARWLDRELNRRYVVVAGRPPFSQRAAAGRRTTTRRRTTRTRTKTTTGRRRGRGPCSARTASRRTWSSSAGGRSRSRGRGGSASTR